MVGRLCASTGLHRLKVLCRHLLSSMRARTFSFEEYRAVAHAPWVASLKPQTLNPSNQSSQVAISRSPPKRINISDDLDLGHIPTVSPPQQPAKQTHRATAAAADHPRPEHCSRAWSLRCTLTDFLRHPYLKDRGT